MQIGFFVQLDDMKQCVANYLVKNGLDEEAIQWLCHEDLDFDSPEMNYSYAKALYHLFIQHKTEQVSKHRIPPLPTECNYFDQAIKFLRHSYKLEKSSKAATLLGILYECNLEMNVG